MKRSFLLYSLLIFVTLLFCFSCKNKTESTKYDSPTQGTIHISVDESFKPVISEEIKVYQSSYPDAHIIAAYKPEAECLSDLQNDSVRMIITAQGLTDNQEKNLEKAWGYRPNWDIVAYDAVNVIVNSEAKDSVFKVKKLQKLLTDSTSKTDVVVDGNKATSTVRYLLDSLLKGKTFSANVRSADSSKGVINYVSNHVDAVGFVGSSWVGNEQDPEQVAEAKKIKQALIECKSCGTGYFYRPSQETIINGQYPMIRPLYYIIKENHTGLGTGFVNFLTLERGQLIFRRSYLVPGKMDFELRQSAY